MSCKFTAVALALCAAVFSSVYAAEFSEGRMRLVIHEGTGYFSIFYLADIFEERWEPVFTASNPGTSFLAVNVNDREFRLGESASFRISEVLEKKPAIVFESSFLVVREEFSFVKVADSAGQYGLEITFRIENRAASSANVGMRFLFDTNLGEGTGKTPFSIWGGGAFGGKELNFEAVVRGNSGKKWWSSGNGVFSLMGSISGLLTGTPSPDYLHFANWALMDNAVWKVPFSPGRSFDYPSHSSGDSAVCYYYEPVPLASGASLCYAIMLVAVDNAAGESGTAALFMEKSLNPPVSTSSELRSLLDRLDRYIAGEITLSREELAAIEQTAAELKASQNHR